LLVGKTDCKFTCAWAHATAVGRRVSVGVVGHHARAAHQTAFAVRVVVAVCHRLVLYHAATSRTGQVDVRAYLAYGRSGTCAHTVHAIIRAKPIRVTAVLAVAYFNTKMITSVGKHPSKNPQLTIATVVHTLHVRWTLVACRTIHPKICFNARQLHFTNTIRTRIFSATHSTPSTNRSLRSGYMSTRCSHCHLSKSSTTLKLISALFFKT
jgi:hypothetical protein